MRELTTLPYTHSTVSGSPISLDDFLPEFQHYSVTYRGASYIQWLILHPTSTAHLTCQRSIHPTWEMGKLLLGSASLLQELPHLHHHCYTYSRAKVLHLLVLQGDLAGIRERQGDLPTCRHVTCTREDKKGETTKVTNTKNIPFI